MTALYEQIDVVPTQTFILDGVQWLPHYRDRVFVSPGYPRQNKRVMGADELRDFGATERMEMLWSRGWLK